MPYLDLLIHPTVTSDQAAELASGITDAMVNVMGKRREVTAVRIAAADSVMWTIGDGPCALPTAYLDVKITAGTNSAEEKARLLARLHALLNSTFGTLAEASYIVIHELPAENWGYAGRSQADRFAAHDE